MTKGEVKKILGSLSVIYPQAYKHMDLEQQQTLIDEWLKCFGKYPSEDVKAAVDYHIKHSQFNPSISAILAYLNQNNQSLNQQWREAHKCLKCEDTGFVWVAQKDRADMTFFCDCELGKLKAARQMEDHREHGINWRTRSISEVLNEV